MTNHLDSGSVENEYGTSRSSLRSKGNIKNESNMTANDKAIAISEIITNTSANASVIASIDVNIHRDAYM